MFRLAKLVLLFTAAIILISSVAVADDPVEPVDGTNTWEFLIDKFKDMYKDFGCCMPHCMDTPKPACLQEHGGRWTRKACSTVEKCIIGCCTPFCVEYTAVECKMRAGKPHNNVRCNTLKKCEKSCCIPFCFDMTEVKCKQKQGKPRPEKCEDIEECTRGCCLPDCDYVTEKECTQAKGKWHEDDTCDEFDECDEVCCKESALLTTRQACKDVGGTPLKPSECPGFKAKVIVKDIVEIDFQSGEYADYEYILDVQTCDKNINGRWIGTITWVWTIHHSGRPPYTKTTTVPVLITPSSGSYTYTLPGFGRGWGTVSEKSFKVTIYIPLMMGGNIKHSGTGPVTHGVEKDCGEESKKIK